MANLKKRYGPYVGTCGHLFYTDEYDDDTRKTVLVHRELMEQHLGRSLGPDEHVHHINENPADNRIENLEIKTPAEHARHHAKPPELVSIVCGWCGKQAVLLASMVRHNQDNQGKAGPFCGRSCAGRWSQDQQRLMGRVGRRGIDIPHGTDSGYGYHGCRCETCRSMHAARARKRRNDKKLHPEVMEK